MKRAQTCPHCGRTRFLRFIPTSGYVWMHRFEMERKVCKVVRAAKEKQRGSV